MKITYTEIKVVTVEEEFNPRYVEYKYFNGDYEMGFDSGYHNSPASLLEWVEKFEKASYDEVVEALNKAIARRENLTKTKYGFKVYEETRHGNVIINYYN